MTTEQNKAVVRRFYEEVFNQGRNAVLDEICVADYVNNSPGNDPRLPKGREGLRQLVSMYRNAIPDIHFTIEDMIAEGDVVICRWSSTGTHKGDLLGIPPSGKRAVVTGTDVERMKDGKLAVGSGVFDQLGLLQQLGVIPSAKAPQPSSSPSKTPGASADRPLPAR